MQKTIFISSTFQDLVPHRERVWQVLQNFDVKITGMETFGARKSTPLDTCLKELEESDIYIGVISMCYGSIDNLTGKSYTQLEYDKAKELGLDILIYLIDGRQGIIKTGQIDFGEKQLALNNFKKILMANHTVDFFIDENDLGQKINKRLENILPQTNEISDRPLTLPAKVIPMLIGNTSWRVFVGYLNGRPFEIFSGLIDDETGIMIPKNVNEGFLIKNNDEGYDRFDFQFLNKRGYKTTLEGINTTFDRQINLYDKILSNLFQNNVSKKRILETIKLFEVDNIEYTDWNEQMITILRMI